MRRRWILVGVVVVALPVAVALLARAERQPTTGSATIAPPRIRDSAGVRIVEHGAVRGAPPAFVIEEPPLLSLGGVREVLDEEFDARNPWTSAVRRSDGRIVVNDAVQLKFFDAAGALLQVAGGKGKGPGEFTAIRELCRLPGDTLLAIEYGDDRLSVWSPEGTHVRTVRAPGFLPRQPCFGDGSFVVQTMRATDSEAQLAAERDADSAPHARMRADGTILGDFGRLPTSSYASIVSREVSTVAAGDLLYVGDAKSYEIRIHDADGALVRIVRTAEPPVPYTDEQWESDIRSTIPRSVQGPQRAEQEARMRRMPRPEAYPAYARVRVDEAGRLWVEDYHDERPHGWTVFDADGLLLGRIMLDRPSPQASRPQIAHIERDVIVIRRHDGDGAVHLDFHRLLPVGR